MNAQQCCNLHVNIFRCDHVDTFRCLVDGAAATLMLSTKHVVVLQSTLPIYMLLFADVPNAFRYAIRHSHSNGRSSCLLTRPPQPTFGSRSRGIELGRELLHCSCCCNLCSSYALNLSLFVLFLLSITYTL